MSINENCELPDMPDLPMQIENKRIKIPRPVNRMICSFPSRMRVREHITECRERGIYAVIQAFSGSG